MWGGRVGRTAFEGTSNLNKNSFITNEVALVSSTVTRTYFSSGSYAFNGVQVTINGVSKFLFTTTSGIANIPFTVPSVPGNYSMVISATNGFLFNTSASPWTMGNISVSYTVVAPSINGSCGSSNGTTSATAPAANFCNSGNYSGLFGSGPWSWSCIGSSGGSTAACSTQKTSPPPIYNCSQCSPIYSYANESFISNDASCGTSSNIGAKTYTQNCGCGVKFFDYSNFTSICTPPVNGACGLSNGQTLPTAPTANFCSAGIYNNDMSGSGPWNWSCAGSNGGSPANCSANKTPSPTVSLNAVPGIINVDNNPSWASGTSISLTWNNITNATTCTTDWNGASVGTSNGSSIFSQTTSSKNYTITCTGPGGTTSATANVFSACYPNVCASNQCVRSTTGPVSATSSAGCASSNKCSMDSDCQARVGSNWREIAP